MKYPCFGAKKNANKNTNVCNKTIKPPVAPFKKKLKYAPIKLVIEPTRILIKINLGNLSVSKYAVAPGVITIAMTRKAPTVWRAATHEADNNVKKISFNLFGFKPIDRA